MKTPPYGTEASRAGCDELAAGGARVELRRSAEIKARIYWKPRLVLFSWKQKDCVIFANRNLVCG